MKKIMRQKVKTNFGVGFMYSFFPSSEISEEDRKAQAEQEQAEELEADEGKEDDDTEDLEGSYQ